MGMLTILGSVVGGRLGCSMSVLQGLGSQLPCPTIGLYCSITLGFFYRASRLCFSVVGFFGIWVRSLNKQIGFGPGMFEFPYKLIVYLCLRRKIGSQTLSKPRGTNGPRGRKLRSGGEVPPELTIFQVSSVAQECVPLRWTPNLVFAFVPNVSCRIGSFELLGANLIGQKTVILCF